jgi:signal transduction histidine kinase/CHASE3 domain sensor protein
MGLASAVLATLLGAVLLILLLAIGAQRDASDDARDATDAASAALALRVSVGDLETGVRGFLLTGQERFLEPWQAARRRLDGEATRLERLADQPRGRRLARDGVDRMRSYLRDYSVPLVSAARRDRTSARTLASLGDGKRRIDDLRDRFARLVTLEQARATAGRARAADRADQALIVGAAGLVLTLGLLVAFGLYLARAVARPIRRVAGAARRVASGDLAARVPRDDGAGEVGELGRAFNAMAASLQDNQGRLHQQQAELMATVRGLEEEQQRTARFVAFGRRTAGPGDVEDLGAVVLEELAELVGADRGVLYAFDSESEGLPWALAERGLGDRLPPSAAALLERVGGDRAVSALHPPLLGPDGDETAREVAASLVHAGATVGVLVLWHAAGTFDDDRIATLEDLLPQAASTLSSALALQAARERASVIRAVLDATPDAIALLDRSGRTVLENPPMRTVRAALVESVRVPGGGYRTNVSGQGRDPESEVRDELALLGTGRTFARYGAPVHDRTGALVGRLVVLREVTLERESERMKDEFFALVSHELRTPLTSIIGYLELVLDDESDRLDDDHRSYLEVVGRNASRLLRLVGDLLFVAQVEAGTMSLELGEVDLARLVAEALETARPRAEARSLALVSDVAPLPPLRGDRDRLGQVLDNLVTNACKFTPSGGRVEVRARGEDGVAVLEVADTGPGIPEEEQEHLFERFFRASSATAESIPGVGLGLTIVKAIAEAHGGRVVLESEVGIGTTFRVELPLPGQDGGERDSVEEVDSLAPSRDAGGR